MIDQSLRRGGMTTLLDLTLQLNMGLRNHLPIVIILQPTPFKPLRGGENSTGRYSSDLQ